MSNLRDSWEEDTSITELVQISDMGWQYQPLSSFWMSSIDLKVSKSAASTEELGNMYVQVYNTDAEDYFPTGTALATATRVIGDFELYPEFAWETFTFDTTPALWLGTTYAIVLSAPDAKPDNYPHEWVRLAQSFDSGTPPNVPHGLLYISGSGWQVRGNCMHYKIYGTLIRTAYKAGVITNLPILGKRR